MLDYLHIGVRVNDLEAAAAFYGELLGCERGRSDTRWIDWNFYGHQLVTHCVDEMPSAPQHNAVDSHAVPVPHFGVVLDMEDWQELADKLQAAGTSFVIEPYVRFKGQPGEQATMFFHDPAGNALEFKAFKSLSQLFAV